MRDFGEMRWSPAGSRPHLYLTLGAELTVLCDRLCAADGPLAQWYPEWTEVLRVVPPSRRHITLAWLDTPTTATPAGSWDAVGSAVAEATAGCGPIAVTAHALETTSHGVVLLLRDTGDLRDLAAAAERGLYSVYGTSAPVRGGGRAHIALAYGCAVADTTELVVPVPWVSDVATEVTLVDVDTFAVDGLTWCDDTAHRIPFGLQTALGKSCGAPTARYY